MGKVREWVSEVVSAIPAKRAAGLILALATAGLSLLQSSRAQDVAEDAEAASDSLSWAVEEAVSYAEFSASRDSLRREIAALRRELKALRGGTRPQVRTYAGERPPRPARKRDERRGVVSRFLSFIVPG